MCDLDRVYVKPIEVLEKAHQKKYPDDTVRVLQVNAPNCLVEWHVSSPVMILRGWAYAEDKPKTTKDIRWYSRKDHSDWLGFLQTTIEKNHA